MLRASANQGVTAMVATPHFYPMENSPERFLSRRNAAAEQLREVWQKDFPKLYLGAEVYYFEGIAMAQEVEALCIGDTGVLLLEMPFSTWSERMVKEIKELHGRQGITVLMAHIERYMRFQKDAVWEDLLRAGVLMQSNAEFFLHWNTRKKARRMLREERIHLLGSDCHNMKSRPPMLGEALRKLSEADRQQLEENIREFLPELCV